MLQLFIEREEIIKEIFCQQMKFKKYDYYRVPPEITQENLPLGFQYYNALFPLLENLRAECYRYYLEECQKCTRHVLENKKEQLEE